MSDEMTTETTIDQDELLADPDVAAETDDSPLEGATDESDDVDAGDDADESDDADAGDDADESDDADAGDDADARPTRVERLELEGEIAADYLEELLDIADLDGDLDMDVEGDRAAVSIVGAELSQLVGGNGEVLEALQELTRLAVYRETGERSRLMLDISGYRAEKRTALIEVAREAIARVQGTGEPAALEAMTAFERKVVHDEVKAAGLVSESEGMEPRRHVVILPG